MTKDTVLAAVEAASEKAARVPYGVSEYQPYETRGCVLNVHGIVHVTNSAPAVRVTLSVAVEQEHLDETLALATFANHLDSILSDARDSMIRCCREHLAVAADTISVTEGGSE